MGWAHRVAVVRVVVVHVPIVVNVEDVRRVAASSVSLKNYPILIKLIPILTNHLFYLRFIDIFITMFIIHNR